MKLHIFLETIENLKTNVKISYDLEEEIKIFIEDYIVSIIKDEELEILKKLNSDTEIDLEILSWVLFYSEIERKQIFENLNDETFMSKSTEAINQLEEFIAEKREKNPLENIQFEFFKYVSLYIANRGINNKYAIRFLKNISWRYESYDSLTNNQKKYLNTLITENPIFFNNDFLKEEGFSNECEIMSKIK
jgi:hypothetical protein